MEKSNPNLFESIRQKLFGDATLLVNVRLSVAKTLFIFLAFVYFFAYLFVIGGYNVEFFRVVVFYLYPLFAFSTIALLYNIIRYAIVIYLDTANFLIVISAAILSIIYIWLIATHVGLTLKEIVPLYQSGVNIIRPYIGF